MCLHIISSQALFYIIPNKMVAVKKKLIYSCDDLRDTIKGLQHHRLKPV